MNTKQDRLAESNSTAKGLDSIMHAARMSAKAGLVISLTIMLITGCWTLLRVDAYTSPTTPSWGFLAQTSWQDTVTPDAQLSSKIVLLPSGEQTTLEIVKTPLWQSWINDKANAVKQAALEGLGWGLAFGFLVYVAGWRRGRRLSSEHHLRGAQILNPNQLTKAVKKVGIDNIKLADIPMPLRSPQQHIIISGAPGTGKSVLINSLLDQIRHAGDRAVIYDRGGEFLRNHHRPQHDVIISEFDDRAMGWHPVFDIENEIDCSRIAEILMPQTEKGDAFWTRSAADLLDALLARALLTSNGKKNPEQAMIDVLTLLMSGKIEDIEKAVKNTPSALSLAGGGKTAQSIIATMSPTIKQLANRILPSLQDPYQSWLIKDWLDRDDDAFVYLSTMPEHLHRQKPSITCFISTLLIELMRKGPTTKRTWLILDELPSLQKIATLQTALAEGRKYGLCCILGIQAISQLIERYGKEGAQSIVSCIGTHVHFRSADPDTAEFVSKQIGGVEVESFRYGTTVAANDGRNSDNFSEQIREKRLIMPSEISALETFEAILKLPALPIAKVKIKPVNRHKSAQPIESIDNYDSKTFLAAIQATASTSTPPSVDDEEPEEEEAKKPTKKKVVSSMLLDDDDDDA